MPTILYKYFQKKIRESKPIFFRKPIITLISNPDKDMTKSKITGQLFLNINVKALNKISTNK